MVHEAAYAEQRSWHANPRLLERYMADLIAEEVARLRPGEPGLPMPLCGKDRAFDERGLGLDSLERLAVASVVSEALHLHESHVDNRLIARPFFGDWLEIAKEGLDRFDTRLTFRTSGSSGKPKACMHLRADLEQEVAYVANLLIGRRRVLSAVPAQHIYGFLFTVLLPQRLCSAPVRDVRNMSVHGLMAILEAGDLLISHPAHWALFGRFLNDIPSDVIGISSTSPCPEELSRSLTAGGLARFVEIYGSSETAGIGWRDTPGAPYRLLPFWQRDPSDESTLIRRASEGSPRRVALPDRLTWQDNNCFTVGGRLDEAVQVAGTNVYPARVARVLMEHPHVMSANVRLMAPHEGDRLKAYIVITAGTDPEALRIALMQWANARLNAAERPKSLTFGSSIPLNNRGKLADWPLHAEVSPGNEPKGWATHISDN